LTLPSEDVRDLVFFFGAGTSAFERSPFGYQLEKAERVYYDSAGKVVPRVSDPWAYMKLGPAQHEGGYEPDLSGLETSGRVSRRLARLQRAEPRERQLLELLYGDQGEHWAGTPHGRSWALAPHTVSGRTWLEQLDLEHAGRQRAALKPPAGRLAAEADAQRVNPTEARGLHLRRTRDAIDLLVRQVEGAWLRSAGEPSSEQRA
jgi:hypothetical protein